MYHPPSFFLKKKIELNKNYMVVLVIKKWLPIVLFVCNKMLLSDWKLIMLIFIWFLL